MNYVTTIICISNPLLRKGLAQYISSMNANCNLVFSSEITEIIQYKDEIPQIIFLDQKLLPDPCVYCLDKIKNAYRDAKLIAVTDEKLPDNMMPYFDEVIYGQEDEDVFTSKLYKIYSDVDSVKEPAITNSQLSEREIEILKFVALGFTNKEIGDRLFISAHTVITHRKNITAKLGIKTIAGLTVYAVLNGIITSDETQH